MTQKMSKNDGFSIILKKLFIEGKLKRSDFVMRSVSPRGFRAYNDEPMQQNDAGSRTIKHSTNLKWFQELEQLSLIERNNTGKNTNRGDPILKFDLTFFGLIKLLAHYKEKFDIDIWNKLWYHVPGYFGWMFPDLERIFSREHLFYMLTKVCNNTKIFINYDPRNNTEVSPVFLKGSDYSRKYKWIHHYCIEVDINHVDTVYHLVVNILVRGINCSKKLVYTQRRKVISDLQSLIFCAYLHELMNSMSIELDDNPSGFLQNIDSVLDLIKNNPIMKEKYLKFLERIENIEQLRSVETKRIKRYIMN